MKQPLHPLALATGAALVLAFLPLRADGPPPGSPVTDPARVAQHYHEVAARPEFRDVEEAGVNPRLEDLLSDWFKELGAKVGELKYTSRMPAFESLLMSVLVAFSLGILIYIIFRLTRGRSWTWTESHPPAPGEKTVRAPEFHDEEIRQALQERNWHGAWLAAWRQFLARLERGQLVEADRTRTNREYLGQLRVQPLPASALALVTAMVDRYDRFIYGRAAINEDEWKDFHHQIEEAALMLHLDEKRPSAAGGGIAP